MNRLTRRSSAALAASAIVLLAGCLGGSKDDEVLPAELVDFKSSLDIRKVWSASLGGIKDNPRLGLAPASNGARVYAAGPSGTVAAFDALSGKSVWRIDSGLTLAAGPGVGRDTVALGTADGDVLVLAAEDGSTVWSTNVGSEILAAPALADGIVVVRTVDGRLLGLDAGNGQELWSVVHPVQGLTLRGTAAPAISAGCAPPTAGAIARHIERRSTELSRSCCRAEPARPVSHRPTARSSGSTRGRASASCSRR